MVKNAGPGAAEQVTAIDSLPRQAGFGTATTSQGTCTHKPKKRTVECALGIVPAGGSATITIEVKPTRKGTITNTVAVSSPSDPNSPVSASAATQVLP